jgi:serine protease Do
MNDGKLLEEIERYLNGEMNADERKQFEAMSSSDAAIAQKIAEHKEFLKVLKQYSDRLALEARLNEIHEEIDVHTLADELIVHPSAIVRMWRNHHSKISVAASIAIFAVMSILFLTGKFNNDSQYVQLRRQVGNLENKVNQNQRVAQGNIHAARNSGSLDKFRATGFAITVDGLIATNYHVVGDNDSVFVQNAAGKLFKAAVVYVSPKTDVAILKITDTAFKSLPGIPYTFKKSESDLAEKVYTYGYSQDSPVYGPGELTSDNGLNGDSTKYQVSIPLGPGNSGGPLMDSRGNIIGIVNAKETQVDGVNLNFAIKSSYLLSAVDSVSKQDNAKVILNTKNTMANMSTQQQLKKLKNYVFMVKVGL